VSDVGQLKDAARELWSRGDYVRIAERLEPAAEALVEACAISAGQEVLDVASGNGNVAVAAAREGAAVVGSDLTPAMVELGRMRTELEGLDVEWVVADAEELPFEDDRFDCATSAFGVMFAPRPEVVARELFRVVRPGGTVGLANWTPEGFIGRWFALAGSYAAASARRAPSVRVGAGGGRARALRRPRRLARLRAAPVALELRERRRDAQVLRRDRRARARAHAVARRRGQGADREEFVELVGEFNQATGGSVEIDGEYLLVVARRRG